MPKLQIMKTTELHLFYLQYPERFRQDLMMYPVRQMPMVLCFRQDYQNQTVLKAPSDFPVYLKNQIHLLHRILPVFPVPLYLMILMKDRFLKDHLLFRLLSLNLLYDY